MSESDTDVPIRTDPEFRAAPWRLAPTRWQQALEAARDDPSEEEFISMLVSLPDVFVDVIDTEKSWCPTVVTVSHVPSARTGDLLTIAHRAGWECTNVTWERNRITFAPRGESR